MVPVFLFLVGLCLQCVDTATVSSIYVNNNQATTKGSDVKIVCSITNFGRVAVMIYKTDSPSTPSATDGSLNACITTKCLQNTRDRYSFSSNDNEVIVTIHSLDRNEDQKYWHCFTQDGSHKTLWVKVFTPPSSLKYTNVPTHSQDLSTGPVSLTCETDCAYPQPALTWFYKDGSKLSEYSPGHAGSTSDCTDQEKSFSYSLTLTQYTTFTNNEDKTVKFKCGIPAVPAQGLLSTLYSPESPDISFAVQVTSVSLTGCSSVPGTTIVGIAGVAKQLCCSPSTSRPPAVIVWYIDNTERHRSTATTFTFAPTNNDHEKNIYCKAFNIPPETNAASSIVHKLYIRVPVTAVTLKDGSSSAGSAVTVTQGVSKTLACEPGTSRPAPSISWYIGGSMQQNSTGTTYTFTPTNADHDMVIYCTAVNTDRQAVESGKSNLYVQVEAGTPEIKNKPSDALLSGDEVRLVCQTTPTRPAASVTWRKGGVHMTFVSNRETTDQGGLTTVTSTVTFTPVQTDHQKYIVCETAISGQSSATEDRTQVTVWWPPSALTVTPSPSFPWREGQTDKYILCGATNMGNPNSSETWTSLSGSPQPDGRLKYASLTYSHDGEAVTCTLVNGYTQAKNICVVSKEIRLNVQYEPIVTIRVDSKDRQTITANEGQSIHAECTAKGNPSPHTVEWLGHTGQAPGNLSFPDIDRRDDTTYICRALATSTQYPSYDFTTEKMLTIAVNYPPQITISTSTEEFVEYQQLQIDCNAAGKPSIYTYRGYTHSWKGQQVHTYQERVWDIHYLKLEDSGTYTCFADNGILDRHGQLIQEGSVDILVQGSPKILAAQNKFLGTLGNPLRVSLPFYSHPTHKAVRITRDGVNIVNNDRITVNVSNSDVTVSSYGKELTYEGNVISLQINNLATTDCSQYTLEVVNDLGQVSWSFAVFSYDKPETPTLFSFKTYFVMPFLYWESGFNGGYNQSFAVEITPSGKDAWVETIVINEADENYQLNNGAYLADVKGLHSGSYMARIVSGNKLGKSDFKELPVPFSVASVSQERCNEGSTAAIVGFTIAGLETIAIITIVIVITMKKRKSKSKETTRKEQQSASEVPENSEHEYHNMTPKTESVEENESGARNVYEQLDPDSRQCGVYEDLDSSKEPGSESSGAKAEYVNLDV